MKKLTALLSGLLLTSRLVFSAATPVIPTGPWTDLFNGKDLNNGWASVGNPPWSVTNGILGSKGGSQKTWLIWKTPIHDLELEVTYKLSSDGANGGIQVRSTCCDRSKTDPTCGGSYQVCGVQLDMAQAYSGRLFEEELGFLQFDGQNIDDCRRTLKIGEWTTETARVVGANISMWLNGQHCLDYVFTKAENLNGTMFAFQSHAPFDLIEYKSIKIRNLDSSAQVLGCTNLKSSNYNPKATVDDGSCKTVGIALSKKMASQFESKILNHFVVYTIQESSPYIVRLVDAFGIVAKEIKGMGPVNNGKISTPGSGIYFLEVVVNGNHTVHKMVDF